MRQAAVFNSSGTKLGEETLTYDDAGRITENSYTYSGKTVKDTVTYTAEEDGLNPDGRISSATFAINGTTKASATNMSYDKYKRLYVKDVSVGSNNVRKSYGYTNDLPHSLTHTQNRVGTHNYTWSYDGMRRKTKVFQHNYMQITKEVLCENIIPLNAFYSVIPELSPTMKILSKNRRLTGDGVQAYSERGNGDLCQKIPVRN